MKRLIYILIVAAGVKPGGIAAQAVKFNYGAFSTFKMSEDQGALPIFIGMGYEQNIGDRISVSLAYNINATWFDSEENIVMREKFLESYNLSYSQGVQFPLSELSYTSKYFFSDNDERSFYVASGLAMQFVNYRWQINGPSSFYDVTAKNPPDFVVGVFEEMVSIIPLSLQLGHRGSLDGDFGDYSIGLRYNIGNNKEPGDKTYSFIEHPGTKSISFIFSASWGIGWAD